VADADRLTVAVLGTGIMGTGIVHSLRRAGLPVRVWNRSPERAEALADDGAAVADSPVAAVRGADVMLTMLADADAVAEVARQALQARPPIWMQVSTVGVEGTERLARLADDNATTFVDAPVLGTRDPAEKGELRVLASGPDEALDRLEPVFDAIAGRTIRVGPAGSASRLKLVTNSWVLAIVEAVAEAFALADGLGVERSLFLEAIGEGPLDCPYVHMKATPMLERDFSNVMFPLSLASKDARLMQAAAQSVGLELPLIEGVAAALARAAREHGEEDVAATYLSLAPRAGRS
jgi:3-hydroxyisobutyrate dehydrogenase